MYFRNIKRSLLIYNTTYNVNLLNNNIRAPLNEFLSFGSNGGHLISFIFSTIFVISQFGLFCSLFSNFFFSYLSCTSYVHILRHKSEFMSDSQCNSCSLNLRCQFYGRIILTPFHIDMQQIFSRCIFYLYPLQHTSSYFFLYGTFGIGFL